MDASGMLVGVMRDWEVSVKGSVCRSTCWSGEGQPFSCRVPPALPLSALPAQVLVQVSFEEGQKSDVSAQYQHERIFNCSFLSWN